MRSKSGRAVKQCALREIADRPTLANAQNDETALLTQKSRFYFWTLAGFFGAPFGVGEALN
jgi:hypothetical protein